MLTRFAPSPTGHLHLGHALAAKEAFNFAAEDTGQCLLRIEDIDHTRCKAAFTQTIYEDLNWLGFGWPKPVRVQSKHRPEYHAVIANLIERGLAYPCSLTRSDLKIGKTPKPMDMPTGEFQKFETNAINLPFAIRLNLEACLETVKGPMNFTEIGMNGVKGQHSAKDALGHWITKTRTDPIIARKDIGVSYHIAVTHDDALQNITHIVRGMDLYEETPLHVLLQNLMAWPTPIYHHHMLLLREDGEKLSKRAADTTILSLREKGLTSAQVLDMASA